MEELVALMLGVVWGAEISFLFLPGATRSLVKIQVLC